MKFEQPDHNFLKPPCTFCEIKNFELFLKSWKKVTVARVKQSIFKKIFIFPRSIVSKREIILIVNI